MRITFKTTAKRPRDTFTLLIERRFDAELQGWDYADPGVHDAADTLMTIGFNLPAFDDWVQADPPLDADSLAHMMRSRQRLIEATLRRDHEARDGWAHYLAAVQRMDRRDRFLTPMAIKAQKYGQEQAARRKGKPATAEQLDEHGSERNDAIRRRHAALVAANRHDATSQVASEFGLSTRTVRRILKT